MGELSLQEICNIIVLVSAVIIAARNIFGFFKTPVDHISRASIKREETRIKSVLAEQIPELFSKQTKAQCELYEKKFNELSEVVTSIQQTVNEVREITSENNNDIKEIQQAVTLLTSAQLDALRYNMNCIYYSYRPYKKILSCDKKAFIKFYEDYRSMGGNTWIDALYGEVKDWQIVEDESELKLEK